MKGYKKVGESVALSYISHPVGILTVRHGDRVNGMTVAWFCQISYNPPKIAVAISPKRYTWELLEGEEYFGLMLLKKGQEEMCEVFGTIGGRETDKFSFSGIEPLKTEFGVPLIPGGLAAVVFKKEKVIEVGDHLLLIGDAVEGWVGEDDEPLNWFRSDVK